MKNKFSAMIQIKKYIFLSIVSFGSIFCKAQINDVNTSYIGGGFISLSNTKSQNEYERKLNDTRISLNSQNFKRFNFNFQPYAARKLNRKSMFGVSLIFAHSVYNNKIETLSSSDNIKTISSTIGINLFYRYLIMPEKKLHYFLEPSAIFETSFGRIERFAPSLTETKSNQNTAAINAGAIYRFNDRWNVLLSIPLVSFWYRKSRNANMERATISKRISANPSLLSLQLGIERQF